MPYGRKEFLVILIKQDSRLGDYKPAPRYSQLRFRATLIGIFWLWGICAMAADGLIVVPSSYGPKETMDRLVTEVTARGLTIFARKITLQAPRKEAFP
jgi:hypothetical protein